jgi:riboflavin-specific deaminase-like protein
MPQKLRVLCSVAMSLDGRIDDLSPERLLLSNSQDLEAVDRLRAGHDAILAGAGTLRADNSSLLVHSGELREDRLRSGRSPDPAKVTITLQGNLRPDLRFFTSGECPKFVFCPVQTYAGLRQSLGGLAELIQFPGPDLSPGFLLEELYRRGIRSLLIEGGQSIHTLFLQAGCVDEVRVAIAPFFVGQPEAPGFVKSGLFPAANPERRMNLHSLERLGDMAVLWYRPL